MSSAIFTLGNFRHFGRRDSEGRRELEGSPVPKRRVFRHAERNAEMPEDQIAALARGALEDGAMRTFEC